MNISRSLRFIAVLIAMIGCLSASAVMSQVKAPDFAYPRTVSADARQNLDKSLATDDPQGVLRSLIDYTLAQGATGAVNLPGCIALIDSVGEVMHNPVLSGMLPLLEATVYNNVYSSARWKYDRRTAPELLPLPADYTEWSGEQFRYKITGLIDRALADSTALRAVPLKDYAGVITQDRMTAVYYPTLYDFAVHQAVDILQGFMNGGTGASSRKISDRILALYGSVIDNNPRTSAPAIGAGLARQELLINRSPRYMMMSSSADRGERLMQLYRSYLSSTGRPMTEYAGDILLAIPQYDSARRELYDAMKSFIAVYPGYWRKDCIKEVLRRMEQKSVSVQAPRVTGSGRATEIRVSLNNVSRMSVDIYDVSSAPVDKEEFQFTTGMAGVTKVASLPVEVSGETVPFETTRTVSYTFKNPGNYIAVPSLAGAPIRKNYVTKIHVTRVAMATTALTDRMIWTVDAGTGAPLSGVSVSVNPAPYRTGSVARRVGVTDSIGAIAVNEKNGLVVAVYGDDRFALPIYLYNYGFDRTDRWEMRAQGYPSLPLYHPGDSMEWAAICYEYKGGLNRPYAGQEVSAVLFDANRMPVDTLALVTDRFGRVSGGFRLPADGLTGRFSIAVGDTRNALSFEVSDYKLPTFRVVQPKVEQNAPAEGEVTVRGYVETYAGFPLTDAEVTLTLNVAERPRWWYPSPSFELCTRTVNTDVSGDYEIVLGKDVLSSSGIECGYFTADISVLSSTGETQTGSVSFSLAERYVIKTVVPDKFDLTRGEIPVEVSVVNYEDSVVAGGVNVSLINSDSVTVARKYIEGKGSVDVASLSQGTYRLTLTRENADTVTREVILYNPTAETTPCPDVLIWAPDWKVTVGEGRDNVWIYAVNCDTHLLVTLWTPDGIISRRWVKAAKGFNRLPVALPVGVDDATISVMATGGYRQQSGEISVNRADSRRGLRIIAESFRDRTIPGADEEWTLRVEDLRGEGREAAVIADMYNTALDVLARTDWSFSPITGYVPGYRINLSNMFSTSDFYLSAPAVTIPRLRCPDQVNPYFNTYGRSWSSYMNGRVMLRGLSTTKNAAVSEDKLEDEVAVEEVMPMFNTSAKMVAGGVDAGAETTDAASVDAEGIAKTKGGDTFAYRDSNVPLALFRPSLVTDREGRVALSFRVPDANTTWGVRVLAVTDSLLSATMAREVVASKEIMVQPNPPRFVRTDDRAVVRASEMNASEAEQYVTTEIEIFNPADDTRLLTYSRPDTIAAGGNTMVEVEFTVPSVMSFIGYRIKSSTATRTDGEQVLIPVLPSVTPVIDTYPFYMPADRHELSMKLPEMPQKGRVTLQFCENPAWYVVTALPRLLVNESSTAPDAARAIYSAAIARGLLNDNPVIADAIREWSESDRSSEMLTSMLERNTEFKTVLLSATPWMLDAKNDTERMARLALLFDRKLVGKTIDENIALLTKLSCKPGGWSWCSSYPEMSRWATQTVLGYMGRLARLGYLPEDNKLQSMISSALAEDTRLTREDFRKYPDGDYTRYVYLHDLFKGADFPSADATIVNSVTQRILRGWKDAPLAAKAIYAQILWRNNYRSMAGEILGSIRQYAGTSPDKGMWFPSLDDTWYGNMDKVAITALILETFHLVEPTCREVDLLRQWLIMQKGAQDWGSGTTASYVVGAVLSTSASWITPARGSEIRVGRTRIEPESYESITGEVEVSLPAAKVSGQTLKIERKSDTPSWGAVYTRYEGEMTQITSSSCPELSIGKQMPDTMTVGDRVTVRLTVKVDADMDYVTITDDRPACLEPVDQLPGTIYAEGLRFYRENRDSSTRIFIDHLPKGTYILTYDTWVNNSGEYTSGIATVQSQYAPRYSAHSDGKRVIAE